MGDFPACLPCFFIATAKVAKNLDSYKLLNILKILIRTYMNLNELIPNILRFPFGNLTDFLYLCTIIRKTNDNGKAAIINGAHGTRTELLSLHPASLCLAQVQDPVTRRSRPLGLRQAASTNASAFRSQHDLSTPRAPLKAPFLVPL